MSDKTKCVIALFAYMFLCSAGFGIAFSGNLDFNKIIIALLCFAAAKIFAIYAIMLIYRGGK